MSASIEYHERFGAPFWKGQSTSADSVRAVRSRGRGRVPKVRLPAQKPQRCFSHKDLVGAIKEALGECVSLKVFAANSEEKECSVPIILVGPTTAHYQPLLETALDSCVPDGITVSKVMSEEVKN